MTKRCSRCGQGKLFTQWVTMTPNCPRCGYHFEREEGFFLGALVVNIIVTEGMIVALLVIGFATTRPNPPLAALAIGGAILAGLTPIVAYPFTKTTWTAIDMIMRRTMGETYATSQQPAFNPRPRP